MNHVQKQRLLKVAQACRETKHPGHFDMDHWGQALYNAWDMSDEEAMNTCGTPACALGNYAVRRDLQRNFRLDAYGHLRSRNGKPIVLTDRNEWPTQHEKFEYLGEYFGITEDEALELFDADGCGNAEDDHIKAAEYIEQFVVRKCQGETEAA